MELLISSILLLVAVSYLLIRWLTAKPTTMLLDRGGVMIDGVLVPDFERSDVVVFIEECRNASVSSDLAREFLVAMYNTMGFTKEPPAPKLSDDRYEVWGLDDDIEGPLNYVLAKHELNGVRWNQKEILALQTMGDLLAFLSERIESPSAENANNALKSDLGALV